MESSTIHLIGIQKKRKRKWGKKRVMNFPNLIEHINPHIQESQ